MPACPHCGEAVHEGARFCSRCGQEISPGPPAPGGFAPSQSPESYRMKVGEYVKTGWALFKKYPGGFIGFALLSIVLSVALDQIRYLGPLVNFAINMPLQVGPLIVAFRLLQGKNPEFKEFFFGFHYFIQLLLISLVVMVFIISWGDSLRRRVFSHNSRDFHRVRTRRHRFALCSVHPVPRGLLSVCPHDSGRPPPGILDGHGTEPQDRAKELPGRARVSVRPFPDSLGRPPVSGGGPPGGHTGGELRPGRGLCRHLRPAVLGILRLGALFTQEPKLLFASSAAR
ncbi:MAG: zinc ribbon domain-containing protein [Deltaproteobacteria bacterium]|nr:zinc ribbon domain-containing protein [Deltaproteobacteria bacterium]